LISESRAYLDLLFRLLSEADAGIFYLFYKWYLRKLIRMP
jgi:hypothetical protein